VLSAFHVGKINRTARTALWGLTLPRGRREALSPPCHGRALWLWGVHPIDRWEQLSDARPKLAVRAEGSCIPDASRRLGHANMKKNENRVRDKIVGYGCRLGYGGVGDPALPPRKCSSGVGTARRAVRRSKELATDNFAPYPWKQETRNNIASLQRPVIASVCSVCRVTRKSDHS
jgi:hypothetical protein